ncbi:hypothetical protein AHF37_03106 [Paragonimus kellicotti]|nr:hypothetical protein AHF37_03106 [Paragonimus kellicotti]
MLCDVQSAVYTPQGICYHTACLSTLSPTSLPNKSLDAQQQTQHAVVELQAKPSKTAKTELVPRLRLPKTTTSKSVVSDGTNAPLVLYGMDVHIPKRYSL